jgi:hypothetical protein
MGFFSDITGKSAKKALFRKADDDLRAARALGGAINTAYDSFSDAQEQGLGHVVDSYDDARKRQAEGYDQTLGYYNPFIENGALASEQYYNGLGINGDEAQNTFYNNEQNSAGFQSGLDAGVDSLMRRFGATDTARLGADGLPRSGRVLKSLQDYGNRYTTDYINNKLAHLNGLNNQGYDASGRAASITGNYYDNQANLDLGQGQAENQYYQAPAQSRLQGKLGQAQTVYQGQTGYNSGIAQGKIAKSNATNNLFTQGLNLAGAVVGGPIGARLGGALGGYLNKPQAGGTGGYR